MPMYSDSYREERNGGGRRNARDLERDFFESKRGDVSSRLGARSDEDGMGRPRGGARFEPYSRGGDSGMRAWGGGGGVRGGGMRGGSGCYRCGEEGHLARECPNAGPRDPDSACYVCGGPHFARECPQGQGRSGGRGRGGPRGGGRGGGRGAPAPKLNSEELDKQLDDYWKEDEEEKNEDGKEGKEDKEDEANSEEKKDEKDE